MKVLPSFSIFLFLLVSTGSGDAQIVKPISELDLMNDPELHKEAAVICKLIIFANSQHAASLGAKELLLNRTIRYLEYLQTISRVARKKNGGEFPEWINQIKRAATGRVQEACDGTQSLQEESN